MEFIEFNRQMQAHVAKLFKDAPRLFVTDVDPDTLWNLYLDSFPAGTNEVFRERREYDCSCCRHFVKQFGNVVVIKDGTVKSIWGFATKDQFAPVAANLDAYVTSRPVRDVYLAPQAVIGTAQNDEDTDDGRITWHHFNVTVPAAFVHRGADTLDTAKARIRDTIHVFGRSLAELTQDSVATVLELIAQGSLYRGDEWKAALLEFQRHQRAWAMRSDEARILYPWATEVNQTVGRIRNHSMGTLLIDLSAGVDLDEAVRKYEAVVAPTNYKRPQAVFTKKMLEDAQKTVESLNMSNSLGRRFAVLEDVSAGDTLFVDRDTASRVQGGVFDELAGEVAMTPKNFSRAEEVPVDRFLTEILPTAAHVEVLLENRHAGNLVSLLAPTDATAPSMFKWPNGFSWAYTGNIADSMKQRVKEAGGNVEGVLRFSIQWNDDGKSIVDLDAHARIPGGVHIHYSDRRPGGSFGGFLDVDRINPAGVGVENISWPIGSKLRPGKYKFQVHNFSGHRRHSGFDAEVEFDGEVHSFSYRQAFTGLVDVAVVTIGKDGAFSIEPALPAASRTSSKTLWGLPTGQFHRVQFVANSPNHWEGSSGIGNKHLFFMLAGCISDEAPNGFFNEFLRPDLEKHRRVLEALGAKMRVPPSAEQLSGLGFSSTKRDQLVCRVTGRTTRVLKIAL